MSKPDRDRHGISGRDVYKRQVGTLLDDWEPDELQELDEIQATLPSEGREAGEVVRVRLQARLTEAGTLELEALPHNGTARWKVEFLSLIHI